MGLKVKYIGHHIYPNSILSLLITSRMKNFKVLLIDVSSILFLVLQLLLLFIFLILSLLLSIFSVINKVITFHVVILIFFLFLFFVFLIFFNLSPSLLFESHNFFIISIIVTENSLSSIFAYSNSFWYLRMLCWYF